MDYEKEMNKLDEEYFANADKFTNDEKIEYLINKSFQLQFMILQEQVQRKKAFNDLIESYSNLLDTISNAQDDLNEVLNRQDEIFDILNNM